MYTILPLVSVLAANMTTNDLKEHFQSHSTAHIKGLVDAASFAGSTDYIFQIFLEILCQGL